MAGRCGGQSLEESQAWQVDAVAVVSAPAEVQRQRVLARASMDEAKLAAILGRQARYALALLQRRVWPA